MTQHKPQSRLDRLISLLSTGTTELSRKSAAEQIAELACASFKTGLDFEETNSFLLCLLFRRAIGIIYIFLVNIEADARAIMIRDKR